MTQEIETPKPKPQAPEIDLSEAIEQAMDRAADEQVKTVHLFGNAYRCNWWVQEKSTSVLTFSSGTIRRSAFIRASMADGKLVIEKSGR